LSRLTHLATPIHRIGALLILVFSLYLSYASVAHATENKTDAPKTAFESLDINSFGDARLRYHAVNQNSFAQLSEALSLRVRFGAELNLLENSTILIEIEGSENLIENFNDTLNGQITRPVIADPASIELNRLQFQTEILPNTRLTLGRQLIALDDWRFIGHWPFRQNEQTFDAVRLETEVGPGLLNAAYIGRVQRQFGNDSPFGEFEGNSALVNYSLPTPLGRLTAFYYGLDLETGPDTNRASDASSATTGVRINGRHKWKELGLTWNGSLAQQTDFANNPNDYKGLYAAGQLDIEYGDYTFGLKGELLGSDNGQAVQTPLGALHRLQGTADMFLRIPDDGLRDYSVSARYNLNNIAIFEDIQAVANYHWFESDAFNRRYGQEIDIGLSGKWNNIRFGLEYAKYEADSFSSDTQVFIFSTELNFD